MIRVPRFPAPRRRGAVLAIALPAVLLLAATLLAACGGGNGNDEGIDISSDPRVQRFGDELTADASHVGPGVPVNYPTIPPYGGPHDGTPLRCGVYTEPARLENIVHSMEHGAVVLYYQPDLFTPAEVAEARSAALALLNDNHPLIFTPNREIAQRMVLAAWGVLMPLQNFDAATLRAFVNEFEGKGPEDIPFEQAC